MKTVQLILLVALYFIHPSFISAADQAGLPDTPDLDSNTSNTVALDAATQSDPSTQSPQSLAAAQSPRSVAAVQAQAVVWEDRDIGAVAVAGHAISGGTGTLTV